MSTSLKRGSLPGLISNFGKILDPIADKLLVIGLIFALASEHMFEYNYAFIPALIIVLREILISGVRENISSYKESFYGGNGIWDI